MPFECRFAIQCGPAVVRAGKPCRRRIILSTLEGILSPTVYPQDWEQGRAARMAIALAGQRMMLIHVGGSKAEAYRAGTRQFRDFVIGDGRIRPVDRLQRLCQLGWRGSAALWLDGENHIGCSDRDRTTFTPLERPVLQDCNSISGSRNQAAVCQGPALRRTFPSLCRTSQHNRSRHTPASVRDCCSTSDTNGPRWRKTGGPALFWEGMAHVPQVHHRMIGPWTFSIHEKTASSQLTVHGMVRLMKYCGLRYVFPKPGSPVSSNIKSVLANKNLYHGGIGNAVHGHAPFALNGAVWLKPYLHVQYRPFLRAGQ